MFVFYRLVMIRLSEGKEVDVLVRMGVLVVVMFVVGLII